MATVGQLVTREEMENLPHLTVLVAKPVTLPDGKVMVVATQKVGDSWFTVGMPYPMHPEDFQDPFFPATVAFQL